MKKSEATKRKYPIGAELTKNGVHFRVWAPDHKKVTLVLEPPRTDPVHVSMTKE